VITKVFVTGITVQEYKIDPEERKLGGTIYRKKIDIEAADTIRFDVLITKRYIDILDISIFSICRSITTAKPSTPVYHRRTCMCSLVLVLCMVLFSTMSTELLSDEH